MLEGTKCFPNACLTGLFVSWWWSFSEPEWASCKLGVFVCMNCSGTHRDLPGISRIKSIRLDNWEDDLVEVTC